MELIDDPLPLQWMAIEFQLFWKRITFVISGKNSEFGWNMSNVFKVVSDISIPKWCDRWMNMKQFRMSLHNFSLFGDKYDSREL